MGFNIGSIAKDLGINLPKIDLGNIGKTVLDEGKKLLGEVVKDSFTLSNKPGETFADDMNLSVLGENVRLPNPIGRLANKLLGKVDDKLGQFGVNIDFKKALSHFFHLPTEAGDVSVPSVKDRVQTGQIPATPAAVPTAAGAAATGGGAVTQSFDTSAPGAAATGGASEASSGGDVSTLFNKLGSQESDLMGQLNQALSAQVDDKGMITINGKSYNASAYMQMLQFKLNQVQEMMQTLSNILKTEHDTRMNTIANMRG